MFRSRFRLHRLIQARNASLVQKHGAVKSIALDGLCWVPEQTQILRMIHLTQRINHPAKHGLGSRNFKSVFRRLDSRLASSHSRRIILRMVIRCHEKPFLIRQRRLRARIPCLLAGLALAAAGAGVCCAKSDPALHSQSAPGQVDQRLGQIRIESPRERSSGKFVQEFYNWYIAKGRSSEGSGSTDDVLRFKPNVLSLKLHGMLKEEYAVEAKMNCCADLQLDFDPYINAQDYPPNLEARTATYHDGKCRASVWVTDPPANYNLVDPELVLQNGKWVFINFHYPDPETPSDENLIDMIIMLRKDRARELNKDAQP